MLRFELVGHERVGQDPRKEGLLVASQPAAAQQPSVEGFYTAQRGRGVIEIGGDDADGFGIGKGNGKGRQTLTESTTTV